MNAATHNPSRAGDVRQLVYGFGSTGLSVARFMRRMEARAVYVDSRKQPPGVDALREIDPDAEVVFGDVPDNVLDKVSRIVCSPGISERDALLTAARAAGIEVVSDIELFVAHATAPFVAVTGSNGKSTVTTLLALMCNAAGKPALAGANLGEPALDLLAKDVPEIYILELSSFQLQRTRHLPARIAVLLNISPDHLDWHASEDEYREAKYRILREADAVVINRMDDESRARVRSEQTCRSFALNTPRRTNYGIVEHDGDAWLARGDEPLMAASQMALVGVHNQENALAALAAGDLLGLDTQAMLDVLRTFSGLPHRMQLIRELDGVRYINDSKATNVAAAIASVTSLPGRVVLIAGGQGKGGDFAALGDAVHERLRAAVLIGEDAAAIDRALAGRAAVVHAPSLDDAVTRARALAEPGDAVLLAPACASFDQFPNYMERGNTFTRAVEALPA